MVHPILNVTNIEENSRDIKSRDMWEGIKRDSDEKLRLEVGEFYHEFSGELKISEVLCNLIEKGGGQVVYRKDQLNWDMSPQDALEALAIQLITMSDGCIYSDPDQFILTTRDGGDSFEIQLLLVI